MIDLDRIDEYCSKATKAPWQTRFIYRLFRAARESVIVLMQDGPDKDWPNADFIAQARTDLPAVVAELREARGLLQKVAEMNWPGVVSGGDFDYCFFCGGGATRDWALQDPVKSLDHDPDCPYVQARKLLGME